MGVTQRRPVRTTIGLVVAVNDELHGSRLTLIVALPYVQTRLPALNADRLKNAGLGVGIGARLLLRTTPRYYMG
jgi:hypothetical protein